LAKLAIKPINHLFFSSESSQKLIKEDWQKTTILLDKVGCNEIESLKVDSAVSNNTNFQLLFLL
jgi:hypothetical protein